VSKTVPAQKPGKSKQDYGTPSELIHAIGVEFSATFSVDLAANALNRKITRYLGPGSEYGEDSLAVDWAKFSGDAWLNPPFADIEPWAKKCATTVRSGRIFLLTPASVGSNWYLAHVHGRAHVVAISPRVTFVGAEDPYPKDLILSVWSGIRGGFSCWRWK